ncbi:hypothetical protein MN116_001504 [Schistosoma mekongi]|uniref:HSF-type DNA-binding domain-containing protein n=1 Tax=Schistosoma mekongi TaxID=38744 RepID=A0AAE1ZMP8_SCHME|nr:hypothetical protein MN116_001504 [Schistosoma mekongi]
MYSFTPGPAVQSIPAFLTKLKLLVDDEETNDLIYWDLLGTSFHIRDGNRLAKELLPLYFKHNNLSNGFRKINRVDPSMPLKSDTEDMEFSHPYFIRNKDSLLSKIQRRTSNVCSSLISARNHNYGVRIPFIQANSGLNGSISVSSPQRPITATNFLRLAETVRHLLCNQETLSQQISVLKSENQLLYRELSDLREHHDRQSQLIQTLFTFLSAFAKEGRSASMCIEQTKRKALPSTTPSSSRFQNRGLKLDLPKGFQLDRNSVQPFKIVQTSDFLGSHKRPKFDVRNMSAKISNTSSSGNLNDPISDIESVVHTLPSNLQLTPVSHSTDGKYMYSLTSSAPECSLNTQSLTNRNPVNVQEASRYLSKGIEEFPVGLNVEDDGVTDMDAPVLELNWPCNRSNTPYSQTDDLSDVMSTKLDDVTDGSICDMLLNCDSQSEQDVGNNQPFLEPTLKFGPKSSLSKYKKEPIKKQHKTQNTPSCIIPFVENDPQFVSTNLQLQNIDSLPWEKYQDSGFDFNLDECSIPLEKITNLDIEQNQTENSNIPSNGLIVGNEIIPVGSANLNACDDVIHFWRSDIPEKKFESNKSDKSSFRPFITPEEHTFTQNSALDLTSSATAPATWKSRNTANNRLTISASPKVKRKQRMPLLLRKQPVSPLLTPDLCERELE